MRYRERLSAYVTPIRPVTRGALLPLILFLVLYTAAVVTLDALDLVIFTRRHAFWLALIMPWFWWMHHNGYHGLTRARATVALLTRLLLCGVLIALLAEPRAVRSSKTLNMVYALDISDSMGNETTDQALEFIKRTVQEKPPTDRAGLVVFGRNAAVELPPRESFPFEAINVRVDRDGTDLEHALSLSAALLPDTEAGRIVLISDGVQTEGNVRGLLDELRARDIPVDVLPIDYEYEHEVWLETLEVPRRVKLGETYEVAAVLSSLKAGTGRLLLLENDRIITTQQVAYRPGKNRFTMPIYLREAGYYEYTARIEPDAGRDGWKENNLAVNYLHLKGKGKVLMVTAPEDNQRDWSKLLAAMEDAGLLVELRMSYEVPRDVLSLLPYDIIVIPNVPADAFDLGQMRAIRDAVYNQGIGLVMIGGAESFGAGGYNRTPIEESLPVSMDVKQKKVLPKGALAIILHTCEFEQGNTWGKRIAKEAIRVLGAQDEAGILVYSYSALASGEQWLFPLTPVSEYDKLVPLINNAQIGDMPSFATTMELGLKGLKESDAATKHMIVISDGDPSPPPPKLIQQFVNEKISISTVAIQPHGGQQVAIMNTIANSTGGRYYFPQDPSILPSIFIKEAKTLKRSMIQNKTFQPRIGFPSPILKGISAMPPLHGYVITTIKPRARGILVNEEELQSDPVLALWRFGLGSTAAFTADLAPNWGRDWVTWDKYRPFVRQLMTAAARTEQKTHIFAQGYARGTTGYVTIEDYHPDGSFLDIQAEVSHPDQRASELRFQQVGPRSYRASFPLRDVGRYQVLIAAQGPDRMERIVSGFTVPYSPEYLRFRADPDTLDAVAHQTAGRTLAGSESGETLFTADRRVRRHSVPIIDWFLLALALLIPLDVAVRRIQLDWAVIRAWFVRSGSDSTDTMGALLRRKERVDSHLQPAGTVPRRHPSKRPQTPTQTAPPATTPSPDEDASREAPPTTTTGRLLARKRQWQQKQEQSDQETGP